MIKKEIKKIIDITELMLFIFCMSKQKTRTVARKSYVKKVKTKTGGYKLASVKPGTRKKRA